MYHRSFVNVVSVLFRPLVKVMRAGRETMTRDCKRKCLQCRWNPEGFARAKNRTNIKSENADHASLDLKQMVPIPIIQTEEALRNVKGA